MIRSLYTRSGLALVVLAVLGAFAHASFSKYWAINSWSLAYTHARVQHDAAIPPEIGQALPPSHPYGRLWLARDAVEQGQPDQAWTWLEPLSTSTDFWVLSTFAAVYDARGHVDKAIDAWTRAGDWRALNEAGNRAWGDNRLEIALAYYQALHQMNPEAGAQPLANSLWRVQQDAQAAASVLRQSLQAYPESSHRLDWLRRLADFLRVQQEWDEAKALYHKALQLDPRDHATHVSLGWLYYRHDQDVARALAQFQQAVEYAPEQGEGYHAIGLVLDQEGRHTEADPWFVRSLGLEPGHRWWYRDRANAARAAGKLRLAIQVYKEAVQRFPDFDYAYAELAWTYYMDEQYDEASQSIHQAIALSNGRNHNHWTRAGLIYEKVGQHRKALTAYKKALQLAPDNRRAQDGVNRLEMNRASSAGRTR